jgi:hypothetical protein
MGGNYDEENGEDEVSVPHSHDSRDHFLGCELEEGRGFLRVYETFTQDLPIKNLPILESIR